MSESNSSLFTPRRIALSGVVGAAYAALTLGAGVFGIAYGPIQCRVSEALTVLPFLCPATAWGLFAGCIITNILSPYGLLDLVVGSLATLGAGLLTARCPNKWLAPLPPVLLNGILVGAVITIQEVPFGAPAFWGTYLYNELTVAAGELLVCYLLGMVLLEVLSRSRVIPRRELTR